MFGAPSRYAAPGGRYRDIDVAARVEGAMRSMGMSKLKIPAAKLGTARNMNTVAKLAELAAQV